jgi:hypothetical protein
MQSRSGRISTTQLASGGPFRTAFPPTSQPRFGGAFSDACPLPKLNRSPSKQKQSLDSKPYGFRCLLNSLYADIAHFARHVRYVPLLRAFYSFESFRWGIRLRG